jgi:hypothetical protein
MVNRIIVKIKKYALITVLSLFCVFIYAEETANIRAAIYSQKIIKSNGKETFDLNITNGESMAMKDMILLVSNDGDLEIILDKIKIDTIEPKETVIVNMETGLYHHVYKAISVYNSIHRAGTRRKRQN